MNQQVATIETTPGHFPVPTDVNEMPITWADPKSSGTAIAALCTESVRSSAHAYRTAALAAIGCAIHIHLHGDNSLFVKWMQDLGNEAKGLVSREAICDFMVERAQVLSEYNLEKGEFKVAKNRRPDLIANAYLEKAEQNVETADLLNSITSFNLEPVKAVNPPKVPIWMEIMKTELFKQIRHVFTDTEIEGAKPMTPQELRKHADHCIDMGVITLEEVQAYITKVQAKASKAGTLAEVGTDLFYAGPVDTKHIDTVEGDLEETTEAEDSE